ncbi:hypothetical protein C0992_011630, partial [Termitomyces sp. T32_za158]
MSMEDASIEVVNKALRRPHSPPTHEWCLANSPKAQCVAKEQGWDLAWVWAQMGEKSAIRVAGPRSEGGESSASAVVVVPRAICNKRKAGPQAGKAGSRAFLPRSARPLPVVGVSQSRPEEPQAEATGLGSDKAELWRERDGDLARIQAQAEKLARMRRKRDKAVLERDQLLREHVDQPGQWGTLEGEVGGLLTRLVRAAGLEGMAGVTVPSAAE